MATTFENAGFKKKDYIFIFQGLNLFTNVTFFNFACSAS